MKAKPEYTIQASGTVTETVQALAQALKTRGFGILSNIDLSKIIKEKTGETIDDYVILDVCNSKDALCAIKAHKEIGLALPCKIAVYDNNGNILVSLYKPTEALKVFGISDLDGLAEEVEMELREVVDAMSVARSSD